MPKQTLKARKSSDIYTLDDIYAESDDDSAAYRPRRSDKDTKRRNRMIANLMIYGGIAMFAILCVVIIIYIFVIQNDRAITGIRFSDAGVELRVNHSAGLRVVTEPAGVSYAVSYDSSDSDIVSVDSSGNVKALKAGSAVITAASGGLTARCSVTVKPDTVSSITLNEGSITLEGGETYKAVPLIEPADASDKKLLWESGDSSVAVVSDDGTIKGVAPGTTYIRLSDSVSGIKSDIGITVLSAEEVLSVEFAEKEITLEVGETYSAALVFTPHNVTDKSAVYYTTDIQVATVTNDGLITAKSEGVCDISAYYEKDDTIFAEMRVTVIDPFVITAEPENSDTPPEEGESEAPEETAGEPMLSDPKPADTTSPAPSQTGIEEINGITYVNGILIANKTYALPADYNPGTDDTAYAALVEMEEAAAADGIVLFLNSGFRSYSEQAAIYANYVSYDGVEEADRYSARAGYSEHQSGLAFDLNSFEQSFGETPEGIWLAENCYKYGFIIRYPKEKEDITGYMYEPWHVRYLGRDIAESVYSSGLCLEEYLGITSYYHD